MMPKTKSTKTVKKKSDQWDEAIRDAKRKIKRLKFSIKVFEQKKLKGEEWQTLSDKQ